MLLGIRTVVFKVKDLDVAKKWYNALFNIELSPLQKQNVTVVSPLQEVGEGIKVASIADPFGNEIGLIENPHFKLP